VSRCHGCKTWNPLGDGGPADGIRVEAGGSSLGSIDDHDNLAALHPVHDVRADAVGHLVDAFCGDACFLEAARRAIRGQDVKAEFGKGLAEWGKVGFVRIPNACVPIYFVFILSAGFPGSSASK